MKKIILLLFLGIFTISFSQEGINFEKESFNNILAKAKKENKLIFLDAYTSWCGPCKMLEKNIFPQKKVGEYYNANFINARFDMEKGEGIDLAKKYGVYSYPTLIFLNSNGEVVHRTTGYIGEEEILQFGKEANNPNNRMGSLKERFEKGESNPDFLMNVIKLNAYSDYNFAKQASERYFQTKTTPEFSREEAGILLYFIKSTQDENYKIFVNKKTEVLKYIPENVYQDFDKSLKISDIFRNSINKEKDVINDQYFITEASKIIGEKDAKVYLYKIKLNFYLTKKNYIEYEKIALEYYNIPNNFEEQELNFVAQTFLENISQKKSLKKAIEWSLVAVKKNENYNNTNTLAKLYQKIGDKKNYALWSEKAKSLQKQNKVEHN